MNSGCLHGSKYSKQNQCNSNDMNYTYTDKNIFFDSSECSFSYCSCKCNFF